MRAWLSQIWENDFSICLLKVIAFIWHTTRAIWRVFREVEDAQPRMILNRALENAVDLIALRSHR
jgi:hypothetical protein